MAKIGDLISYIRVGSKKFDKPEWWSAQHKMKKELKNQLLCKANACFNYSYSVNTADKYTSVAQYIDSINLGIGNKKKFAELAPWNPVFRPSKPIIIFKKTK